MAWLAGLVFYWQTQFEVSGCNGCNGRVNRALIKFRFVNEPSLYARYLNPFQDLKQQKSSKILGDMVTLLNWHNGKGIYIDTTPNWYELYFYDKV